MNSHDPSAGRERIEPRAPEEEIRFDAPSGTHNAPVLPRGRAILPDDWYDSPAGGSQPALHAEPQAQGLLEHYFGELPSEHEPMQAPEPLRSEEPVLHVDLDPPPQPVAEPWHTVAIPQASMIFTEAIVAPPLACVSMSVSAPVSMHEAAPAPAPASLHIEMNMAAPAPVDAPPPLRPQEPERTSRREELPPRSDGMGPLATQVLLQELRTWRIEMDRALRDLAGEPGSHADQDAPHVASVQADAPASADRGDAMRAVAALVVSMRRDFARMSAAVRALRIQLATHERAMDEAPADAGRSSAGPQPVPPRRCAASCRPASRAGCGNARCRQARYPRAVRRCCGPAPWADWGF